jgi:hypothetical protein
MNVHVFMTRFIRALVDLFGDLEIIAAAPTTEAHWRQMEALNLTTPPECPLTTQYYSCDDDGLVDVAQHHFPSEQQQSVAFELVALQCRLIV